MGGIVASLVAVSASGDEGAGPENQQHVPIDEGHNAMLTVAQSNGLADYEVFTPLQRALHSLREMINSADMSWTVQQAMLQNLDRIEEMVFMLDLDMDHTRIVCEKCGNGACKMFRNPYP